MTKLFINAENLLQDSFLLARKIHKSEYQPDIIVGIWRGGAPVAIAIHEYFEYLGIGCDHIPVRTSSYSGIDDQRDKVQVYGLEVLLQFLRPAQNILLVDDVFDTGRTIETIISKLSAEMGGANKLNIKVAVPWYKPNRNVTRHIPDYYLHQTDDWLVFPHEIKGLSLKELQKSKPEVANIILT